MEIRQAIARLTPYTPGKRRLGAIKLSSNENPLGYSPQVREAIIDALDEAPIYPDGSAAALVSAIANHRGTTTEHVLVGNGSDEIITLIAATYLNPGDSVVVPRHTFSQYAYAATLFDGHVIRAPMDGMRIDGAALVDAVTETTRIVFACSPNNPTGLALPHAELVSLLDALPPRVLVVVDHAYAEYQTDPAAAHADDLIERYPNLIVLHTFSKVYGLAALRLGYALAPRERIADIARARPPFSVNGPAQRAGIAALADQGFVQRSLRENDTGRRRMEALLDELALEYLPTQANFIAIRPGGPAVEAAAHCERRGVTIRAAGSFGLPEWIRVTIGSGPHIDRLEPILRELTSVTPR